MTDAPTPPPGDIRAELRLRPEQPRVTRLSRKVLITLGGVSALIIMAALFWALDANRRMNQSPTELYSTENRTPADGLAGLPKDYTGIPKLGPALPGDLGRPILSAQDEGKPVVAPDIRTPRADPTEQRRLAEIEAARVAKEGKIPVHKSWSARVRAGTASWDGILTAAALASFTQDQQALDDRIAGLV